jgi:hypothetical protein
MVKNAMVEKFKLLPAVFDVFDAGSLVSLDAAVT